MSKKQVYISIIKVAVVAESEAEACDAMSESLTANLMHNKAILDWEYTKKGKTYSEPVKGKEINVENYVEGTAFN